MYTYFRQTGCNGFFYVVRPGDTMFLIARRFNVNLQLLIRANPQVPNPALIFPGQILCIPVNVPACPNGFIYTVRPGDTMFLIAMRFNISLSSLIAANPQIMNPALIFPGQNLCVPVSQTCPGGFVYIVQPWDTLFSIANRFGTTVEALRRANPQIPSSNLIFAGQAICIPR
jgi:spore coat assembly protein SafA